MENNVENNVFKQKYNDLKLMLYCNNILDQTTENNYFNPRCWYYNTKLNSVVLNLLYKNQKLFNDVNITVDMAVIVLCSLYNYKNYVNAKDYFIVNDRILAKRCYLSRNTIYDIIYILSGLNILYINYDYDNIRIKFNEKLLQQDEYFKLKCEKFFKHDMETIFKTEEQFNSHYYLPYSKRTSYSKLKEIILGCTLIYNSYLTNSNEDFYKLRKDSILYVEIPVHLICRITNKSERFIMKYIAKLYKNTMYLTKHDLVYSDYKYNPNEKCFYKIDKTKHYTNSEYKTFPLNKYTKLNDENGDSCEYGHPKVTPYSAYIYMKNFISTKTGKKVLNNLSKYKRMLALHLRFDSLDDIIDSAKDKSQKLQETYNCNDIFNSINNEVNVYNSEMYSQIQEYLCEDNGFSQYNIKQLQYAQKIDEFTKNQRRLKLYGNVKNRNIESLSKYIKNILNQVALGSTNNFKYYINEVNTILDEHLPNILTQLWLDFNNSNNNKLLGNKLYRAYKVLEHYNLYSQVVNKFKQNILNCNEFNSKYTKNQINNILDMSLYSSIEEKPDCTDIYENGNNIFDDIVLM